MTVEITKLDAPIDVMYLIHKALGAEAARVEKSIEQLEMGSSLQPFEQAFNCWVRALGYHAEIEDTYMTAPLPDSVPARDNEAAHGQLAEMIEDVRTYLHEIGQTTVNARTRRNLYGKVVALRIAQDDHLEEEEEFVLPMIRQGISEAHQLEMARRLLIDQEAQDQQWILDGIAGDLTTLEQQLLADLVAGI